MDEFGTYAHCPGISAIQHICYCWLMWGYVRYYTQYDHQSGKPGKVME